MITKLYVILATDMTNGEETLSAMYDSEQNILMPGAVSEKKVAQAALKYLEQRVPKHQTLEIVEFVRKKINEPTS